MTIITRTSRPFGRFAPQPDVPDAIRGIGRIATKATALSFVAGYGYRRTTCSGVATLALADGTACGSGGEGISGGGTTSGSTVFLGRENGRTFELPKVLGNGGSGSSSSSTAVASSPFPPRPADVSFCGRITSRSTYSWVLIVTSPVALLGSRTFTLNGESEITGDPTVGDRVCGTCLLYEDGSVLITTAAKMPPRDLWVIGDGTSDPLVYSARVPECTVPTLLNMTGEFDDHLQPTTLNGVTVPTSLPGDPWPEPVEVQPPIFAGDPVTATVTVPEGDHIYSWGTLYPAYRGLGNANPLTFTPQASDFDGLGLRLVVTTVTGMSGMVFNVLPCRCAVTASGGEYLGRWSGVVGGALPECDPDGYLFDPGGLSFWAFDGTTARHYLAATSVEIEADAFTIDIPVGADACAAVVG